MMGDKTHRSWRRHVLIATAIIGAALFFLRSSHVPNEKPRRSSSTSAKSGAASSREAVRQSRAEPASARHAVSAPALVADSPLETIARFDAWFISHRRGEQPSIAAGFAFAQQRRAALAELIASNPREALARAVPRTLRAELPPEIGAELETPIDAFGRYEVVAGCGGPNAGLQRWVEIEDADAAEGGRGPNGRYAAHVFGRRLATLSKKRLPIHGIALDDQLAIDETPFRQLESDESGAANLAAATDIAVAVGDRIQAFGSSAALQEWAAQVENAEARPDPAARLAGPNIAAAPTGWTLGEKSVLWIRADFSDEPGLPASDSDIQAVMARASDYYLDVSNGRSSFRTVIVPVALRLSKTMAAYNTDPLADMGIRTEAVALARAYDAANGNSGAYNPDRYDRWIVLTKRLPVLGVSGRGVVGAAGIFLNGTTSATTVVHELGHNHGLHHADGWRPSGAAPAGPGAHAPYGDVFDVMGSGIVIPGAHFSSKAKEILGYLEPAHTPAITKAGTYRIFRHDHRDATGERALRIAAGDYDYWIEHRQLAPTATFTQTSRLQDGVLILWSKYPSTVLSRGTCLLDATPNSPPGSGASPGSAAGFDDAPFRIGETFIDPEHGISITPTAKGGAAPNEWVDVRVGLGAIGENNNPVLAVTPPFRVLPARTDVTFTASGSDPDGDAVSFRWEFGDGQAAMTGATVTKRFLAGGEHTIRCTVLDGRGGVMTRSFDVTIDDPLRRAVQRGQDITSASLHSIVHDGRQFIAAGVGVVLVSPDGTTWTRRPTPANHAYLGLATNGARTIAVGTRPGNLATLTTSVDGTEWLSPGSLPALPQLNAVAFGVGRFVAVGSAGTLVHSPDGVEWLVVPTGVTQSLHAVSFAADRFVATGGGGVILTSIDGITWQNRSLATNTSLTNVAYHRGRWLIGSGSNLWSSTNGMDWPVLLRTLSGTTWMTSVGTPGLLFATAAGDSVRISEDGSTWSALAFASPATSGSIRAVCSDDRTLVAVGTGGRIFTAALESPAAVAPELTAGLLPQFVPAGHDTTLAVAVDVPGAMYQWRKDGAAIAGGTATTLTLSNAQPSDSGIYSVTIASFGGTTTSSAPVTIDPDTARLANLSIRTRAGTGLDSLTLGFVVARSFYTGQAGASPKRLLARGVGPALGEFGVSDVLADPRVDLFRGDGRIDGNDDWGGSVDGANTLADAFGSVGAFPLPAGSKDAALLGTLSPDSYTLQLTGPAEATGVVLAELYDLDNLADRARLVNVSARCQAGNGADALIAGFALKGAGTRTLLIRAIGPTLAAFGVSGELTDPLLQIRSGERVLHENDDWSGASAIATAAGAVGAFTLPPTSKDAALLVSLPAGSYTAQVTGAGGGIGVALVEIYEVPPAR